MGRKDLPGKAQSFIVSHAKAEISYYDDLSPKKYLSDQQFAIH